MANLIKKKSDKETPEIVSYQHKCGEEVFVETLPTRILRFLDHCMNRIEVCGHCLIDLDYEDLEPTENVKSMGWPLIRAIKGDKDDQETRKP